MKRTFFKYQGTGNDFILFDDRDNRFDEKNESQIQRLCNRRFGIGADGLMLLRNEPGFDFRMVYFNSDGRPSSMCGNGGRCIARFAREIGAVHTNHLRFIAVDGPHEAVLSDETVKLKMNDVNKIEAGDGFFYLNTGSPHYVRFSDDVPQLDVFSEGRAIRYNERFRNEGTNVNFVSRKDTGIFVRTYERGVEGETLSCGTGVTASALAAAIKGIATSEEKCMVHTPGGKLAVHFHRSGNRFSDIWLEGPATCVFKGEIEL
jgi:diaminopimelate epimerase